MFPLWRATHMPWLVYVSELKIPNSPQFAQLSNMFILNNHAAALWQSVYEIMIWTRIQAEKESVSVAHIISVA